MMNLLIIRDRICAFFQKWDFVLIPIIKFFYTMIVFYSFRQLFGYNENLYRFPLVLGVSAVCAFVPSGVIFLVAAVLACVDLVSFSLEVAGLMAAVFLVIYFLYLRLVPGKSWIILISMLLLMKLPGCIPLLVAMLVGPVGIVPVICGILLYYFSLHIHGLQPLLTASADTSQVNPVTYLLDNMGQDREMLLFMVVFSVVIMVTYLIYRSSMKQAWGIAIAIGMTTMILGLLAGSILLERELGINVILFGSVISGLIAAVVQVFKCVVDYSRTEIVQFEDDDYYYYVKAVPKLVIAQKDVNVKKINARHKK
ncbi:MAG: hypothetical protein PUC39_07435 [Lachnospiraceae bacterium]|nr:hypothetical protein [Lachnospiraceae bacterium]